jgi:AcrR family transcriptional regulator
MSVRDQLARSALDLFHERGFDATTVEAVADRAGVGRTTFFRNFRSKEDAVLPDHGSLLSEVHRRLTDARDEHLATRLTEGARIVFDHYLTEGSLAKDRYRLTSSVPAIRGREVASQLAYQREFVAAAHAGLGGEPRTRLEAELVASAVVTAHNFVLRDWLRGHSSTPEADFDRAMERVTEVLGRAEVRNAPPNATADVARRAEPMLEELLRAVRVLARA